MQQLRALNANAAFRPNAGYRGFVCNGRLLPGLGPKLHRLRLGGDTTRALRVFSGYSGTRVLSGQQGGGISVHATLARALAQNTAPLPDCYVNTCVRAAMLFAAKYRLVHEASELIICHPTLPLATRFDALFRRGTERVLVSWKSGRGPRHAADLLQHSAQLAMEWRMLEHGHGVRVSRAYVVYLSALQTTARPCHMIPANRNYPLNATAATQLAVAVEKRLVRQRRRKAQGRAR